MRKRLKTCFDLFCDVMLQSYYRLNPNIYQDRLGTNIGKVTLKKIRFCERDSNFWRYLGLTFLLVLVKTEWHHNAATLPKFLIRLHGADETLAPFFDASSSDNGKTDPLGLPRQARDKPHESLNRGRFGFFPQVMMYRTRLSLQSTG